MKSCKNFLCLSYTQVYDRIVDTIFVKLSAFVMKDKNEENNWFLEKKEDWKLRWTVIVMFP